MKKNLLILQILLILSIVPVSAQTPQPCPPAVLQWRNAITPTEIREYLSHAKSITEWRLLVAKIRDLNSGQLPAFWQKEIIESGYFAGLFYSWDPKLRKDDSDVDRNKK